MKKEKRIKTPRNATLETSQMLDVTIDVDTCRQAGRQAGKKKGYATQHQNRTAERIIIINNITDSLSKIQIL